MRSFGGELLQLFRFARQLARCPRQLRPHLRRLLRVLGLELGDFRQRLLTRRVTLAGVSQRGLELGAELATLLAQRGNLRCQLRARLLRLALDARLDLSRPGLALEPDPQSPYGPAQLLELPHPRLRSLLSFRGFFPGRHRSPPLQSVSCFQLSPVRK